MLGKAVYQLPLTTLLDRADKQWGDLSSGVAFLKFIYSEKATKFCEIFTLLLSLCYVVPVKSDDFANNVAFSEYTYEIYFITNQSHKFLFDIPRTRTRRLKTLNLDDMKKCKKTSLCT